MWHNHKFSQRNKAIKTGKGGGKGVGENYKKRGGNNIGGGSS